MGEAKPDLLAANVYRRWVALASTAEESLTIFSPYLDKLVQSLISQVSLDPSAITVVTDVSPASGVLNYGAQLRALRDLASVGVSVRSLARLHAKVLLIDDARATVGSQNFTRYARGSREATALPRADLSGTRFIRTLRQWREESTVIDAELLDRLLEDLLGQAKQAMAAQRALSAAYDCLMKEFEEERRAREARLAAQRAQQEAARRASERRDAKAWFDALVRQSRARLAGRTALATKKSVGASGSWAGWGSYQSLIADRDCDLIRWVRGSGNSSKVEELPRLWMYPIMLADTNRMGYARVGHERITYVSQGLERNSGLRVRHHALHVTILFPTDDPARRNMTVTFQSRARKQYTCTVPLLFDGKSLLVVGSAPDSPDPEIADFASRCFEFLERPATQREFVQEAFEHFRFNKLDRDKHSAGDFFDGTRYELALIDFLDMPVFLARRMW